MWGAERFDVGGFLDAVAAAEPLPAGEAVGAVAGALAAALAEMGAALTLGRARYADAAGEMRRVVRDAAAWRAALLRAADADVAAYGDYLAARRLPHASEVERRVRDNALARTRLAATHAPLNVAALAGEVLTFLLIVAERGNRALIGDLATGAWLAEAAVRGAVLAMRLNLRDHDDADERAALLAQAMALQERAMEICARVVRIAEEAAGE